METSARTVEKGHRTNNREALINAGVAEINRKGLNGFSMRHAAEVCGVSCAAPAKHFGDKNGFIAAIIKKIIKQWHDIPWWRTRISFQSSPSRTMTSPVYTET